MSALTLSC